jgi:hypothetical protein
MMLVMSDDAPWVTDLTGLCERIATRLADAGARHPSVGAVALAVRGREGVDRHTFAGWLGLDHDQVHAAEQGELAFDELPEPIRSRAESEPRLDLPRLGLA